MYARNGAPMLFVGGPHHGRIEPVRRVDASVCVAYAIPRPTSLLEPPPETWREMLREPEHAVYVRRTITVVRGRSYPGPDEIGDVMTCYPSGRIVLDGLDPGFVLDAIRATRTHRPPANPFTVEQLAAMPTGPSYYDYPQGSDYEADWKLWRVLRADGRPSKAEADVALRERLRRLDLLDDVITQFLAGDADALTNAFLSRAGLSGSR